MTTEPAIDGATVTKKMVEVIDMIVEKAGDPNHAAAAGTDADHTPAHIKVILQYCGVEVGDSEEAVAPYRPLLTAAKVQFREEYAAKGAAIVTEQPAAVAEVEKPKGGKKGKNGKSADAPTVEPAADTTATSEPVKATEAPAVVEAPADAEPASEAPAAETPAPKPARKKKEKAAPKSDAAVAIETEEVDGYTHVFPESAKRADAVPRPPKFFLEKGDLVPGSSVHQVDPYRRPSYSPVMPNLDCFSATGNPYPSEPDETVICGDTWKGMIFISHEAWKVLVTNGKVSMADEEVITSIAKAAGASLGGKVRSGIADTLRDLTLYGLAKQTRRGRTRIFEKV